MGGRKRCVLVKHLRGRTMEIFGQSRWTLPDGCGYEISREPLIREHTIIAGATGCGKSTFIHSILYTALKEYTPEQARFILIDPKSVELMRYRKLPHTIQYTDTEAGAVAALEYAEQIMTARYQIMKQRDKDTWTEADGAHIYIIVEELADLMVCPVAKQIRLAIQRLTQKGRAAGISCIAATQAPSRKIIPAEITLNFTARFALACESGIESKQVIGTSGAEKLPDHGEAIYKYRRSVKQVALPYVKREQVQEVITYWERAALFAA